MIWAATGGVDTVKASGPIPVPASKGVAGKVDPELDIAPWSGRSDRYAQPVVINIFRAHQILTQVIRGRPRAPRPLGRPARSLGC